MISQLFYEPKEASEVDSVLREYSAACVSQSVPVAADFSPAHLADKYLNWQKKGALLLSVVGGKLSEGLNFSDELARSVVLVGIPFPNLASPELRERMKYVSRLAAKNNTSVAEAKASGNELYENMAMRAVNQSIGATAGPEHIFNFSYLYSSQVELFDIKGIGRHSFSSTTGMRT